MRKFAFVAFGAVAGLTACGQPAAEKEAANEAAANTAAPERPAYCFFKDNETKGWAAKADKSGNVVVTGKAYRSDARYQVVLQPAKVEGTTAEISPTIQQNQTGFAAPDNWWDVTQTIPDSGAVTDVLVTCGGKTIAELAVPRGK